MRFPRNACLSFLVLSLLCATGSLSSGSPPSANSDLEKLRRAHALDPGSADISFQLGTRLRRAGFLREARERLREARRQAPDRPEILLELARIREDFHAHPAALAAYRETLEMEVPKKIRLLALVGQGNVWEKMGSLARARESFRMVLKENPRSPAALAHLGLVLRKEGDLAGALEQWGLYLEIRPGNGQVERWTLEVRAARREIEQARSRLQVDTAKDPSPWEVIGKVLLDMGDRSGALDALHQAVQLGGGPAARLLRVEILQDLERWAEADNELKKYLKKRPDDMAALYRQALGSWQMADCPAAERRWRKISARSGANPFPYRMLLKSFQCGPAAKPSKEGKLQAEAVRLGGELEGKPDDPVLWLRLALVREAQGKYQELFENLRRSLRANPHASYPLREFRRLSTDRPGTALQFARRMKEEFRTIPPATSDFLMYGYLVWLAGDTPAAFRLFESAAKKSPENPATAIAHAHALSILAGKREQALAELRRAAESHPESASALLALGLMELEGRSHLRGIAIAERLVNLDANSYHAQALLGSAWALAGKHEKAIPFFRAALQTDPADPEGTIKFQLAVSLAGAGRRREARWMLRNDLPWMPEVIYQKAWKLVREYYVDRNFSGQDWDGWRRRFAGQLENREDAYRAIVEMLASLDDRYTRLRQPEETVTSFLAKRSDEIQLDAQGRPLPTSRSIQSTDLSEGIQYIRITNLTDPTVAEQMRRSLRNLRGGKGVILDLRGNPGGVQGDSEMIGSLFLEEGTLLGQVVDRYGRRIIEAGGEESIDPDIPLIVLVDEHTGSAAESLAGALRESGRARVIGKTTLGKGASQVSQLLPGGAMVMVTAARNITPGGAEIEGEGIQPDISLADGDEEDGQGDRWIEKAMQLLKEAADKEREKK